MIMIQAILLVLLVTAGAIYFRYFAHHLIGKLIVLIVGCTLLTFILVPAASHRVARLLGVGRGADLVFYIAHAFLLIMVGRLYLKLKRQQTIITELVRKISIELSQSDAGDSSDGSER